MLNYNPSSTRADEFINHREILETMFYAERNKSDKKLLRKILTKAKKGRGLTHREALVLLLCEDAEINASIFALANTIKEEIYGKRIVLFAPLYLSNHCMNGCLYCPYHRQNVGMIRRKLTQPEIEQEVMALQNMGHKRLALEVGEDAENNPLEYVLESIKTIYNVKHKRGAIRRVNVNIAATSVENYKKLKKAGIGTYILFQETYNRENYEKLHPFGPKHDYSYHTEAMDRAMTGGIDDVGCGVLFGLSDYRYDFTGLLMHAEHLEERFGVGPHTLSMPRLCAGDDISLQDYPHLVNDTVFVKIVAVLRLAVPYTGMIISTRETRKIREQVLELGVSQISGGSCTSIGGYSAGVQTWKKYKVNTSQFKLSDNRTLDEVVNWLLTIGHIPSFCTACYRQGRTGDRFMTLCKAGQIKNCCLPNALLTLKEYLEDYAAEHTQLRGEKIIKKFLREIPNLRIRVQTEAYLQRIHYGQRDCYF
jgi:2-iminoacetate synthase